MKKVLSLLLATVLCLSLCACGGAVKLTAKEVESALADCKGTLNLETSGNNVIGFTYVVEGVNADDLVKKEYTREAIRTILSGDTSKTTLGQVRVGKAISPLMSIDVLLGGDEKEFNSEAFIEKMLDIACDGDSVNYGDWTVYAVVSQKKDSITIVVGTEDYEGWTGAEEDTNPAPVPGGEYVVGPSNPENAD